MTADRRAPNVLELTRLRLRLRDDLAVRRQTYAGQTCYVIEDAPRGAFYRVGPAEYAFLSLLDGHTTVGEALVQTVRAEAGAGLTEADAAALCRWLVDSELATTETSRSTGRLSQTADEDERRRRVRRFHPLAFRLPFGNPGPWLRRGLPCAGWLFGPAGVVLWLTAIVAAGVSLLECSGRWTGVSQIVSPDNLWQFVAGWLLLRLVHETGHGLACTRFGGDVREAGIAVLFGVPLPYVDVTTAWRMPSKWPRIVTAAAGMYAESFVAAGAALVWAHADDAAARQFAGSLLIAASVTTVLFNANPLMRFDGYYMLADWLELPNLATHGQQSLSWFVRRHLFGCRAAPPEWPEGRGRLVAAYGLAAAVWRTIVCGSLVLAAATVFHGAGIVLSVVAIAGWFVLPIGRFLRDTFRRRALDRPSWLRAAGLSLATTGAAVTALAYAPWVERVRAPAIVAFAEPTTVRAPVAGFVRSIRVATGDVVAEGDTLLELENVDLESQLDELRASLAMTAVRARQFARDGDVAAWQVAQKHCDVLEQQIRERRAQCDDLVVRAPVSGRVVADELETLLGTYATAGRELLVLAADDGRTHVEALLSQSDYDVVKPRWESTSLGLSVRVRVFGADRVGEGRLVALHPRASAELPHAAFSATAGGPLAVRLPPADTPAQERARAVELVAPRFTAEVTLDTGAGQLGVGQLGQIELVTTHGTLGTWLRDRFVERLRPR